MGRLSRHARPSLDGCASGVPGDLQGQVDLGRLRGRRWAVCLGGEHVDAELVAVYGHPPHLQARLAVPQEDLVLTRHAGSKSARLHLDLHASELPADLRAALQSLAGPSTRAATTG